VSNNPIPSHSLVLKNASNIARTLRLLGDGYEDLVLKQSLQPKSGNGVFVGKERGFLHGSYPTFYQAFKHISDDDSKRVAKGDATHLAGSQSGTGMVIQGANTALVKICLDKGHACGAGALINTCDERSMMNCK
jgi:hypothetical protein